MPDEFTFKAEWDEGRWVDLFITGEAEPPRYCRETHLGTTEITLRMDRDEAEQLWQQLDSTIGEHVRERERERAAYERATPEERMRMLGFETGQEILEGYALDDPKRIALLESLGPDVEVRRHYSLAEERVPNIVQWLQPGDPQQQTIMYRWTGKLGDGRVGGRYDVVHRVAGPGSTWGPPETMFTGWALDTVRRIAVGRGFTEEEVVSWL